MHLAQADQFSGSLIGQCLGDALGFPVEGSPPDICASYVEQLRTLGIDHTVARRRNYAVGQYTGDSQLARELMLTYAELGRFDPSDYARRIQSIFNENRIVGQLSLNQPGFNFRPTKTKKFSYTKNRERVPAATASQFVNFEGLSCRRSATCSMVRIGSEVWIETTG